MQLLLFFRRLPGDYVTICLRVLYEHGTTTNPYLLPRLWTPSCGIIHSQRSIFCQSMSLALLWFLQLQRDWLVEIMEMELWPNHLSYIRPYGCSWSLIRCLLAQMYSIAQVMFLLPCVRISEVIMLPLYIVVRCVNVCFHDTRYFD